MLALRSNGLNVLEFQKLNGETWLKKNKSYFELLNNKGLITINNNFIKFTKQGYAICDEIISKFV